MFVQHLILFISKTVSCWIILWWNWSFRINCIATALKYVSIHSACTKWSDTLLWAKWIKKKMISKLVYHIDLIIDANIYLWLMTDIDKIYLIHYSHRLGFIHVQIRRKICQSLSTDAPYVGNRSRKKKYDRYFRIVKLCWSEFKRKAWNLIFCFFFIMKLWNECILKKGSRYDTISFPNPK